MPRYRKLHTKTVESLDVNDMPDDFTRLLWVLLPLGLCAEGRGVDNARWVQSKIFPLRLDVTIEMIGGAMAWYESRGMLVRYQVDGRGYFHIPTFHRYQGNTVRETESMYPDPPDYEPPKENDGRSWISETVRQYKHEPAVYVITCEQAGKHYVGASEDAHNRIRAHLRELENGQHPMAVDFQEHGRESIKIQIVAYLGAADELKELEQETMDKYGADSLYNVLDAHHHWKWQSDDSHAPVMHKSSTDAVFSIQYSDADSKELAPGGAPPPEPPAPDERPARARKRKAGNGKNADPPVPTEHQAIFSTLLQAFGIDPNLLTKEQAGRFARLSKKIRDGTYTAADVEGARQFWYTGDWRGKRGSPPANDAQFLEALSRYRKQATQLQGRRLEPVECLPAAP